MSLVSSAFRVVAQQARGLARLAPPPLPAGSQPRQPFLSLNLRCGLHTTRPLRAPAFQPHGPRLSPLRFARSHEWIDVQGDQVRCQGPIWTIFSAPASPTAARVASMRPATN
eukprot:EG_transcript_35897